MNDSWKASPGLRSLEYVERSQPYHLRDNAVTIG